MTNLLKASELDLKRLANTESESKSDEQIKQNILTNYGSKLQLLTRNFKDNEKNHYIKVKEFHGDDDHAIKKRQLDDGFFAQLQEQNELDTRHSDEEINGLVKSINDLAAIFKDLSVLVVEQGTILDRIDYNIESAKDDMVSANKDLSAVHKSEKSIRARNCIKCQVTWIIVLSIMVALKYT